MAAAATAPRSFEGMEVPIVGSDRVQWIELAVSSASLPLSVEPSSSPAATAWSSGSCHVVPGDPPAYLIWRIHNNLPNVLELVELFPCKDFPENGLHLGFREALKPFAFICKNENESTSGNAYLLYVVTVSGIAYLLNLRSPFSYISGSVFPQNDVTELNLQTDAQIGKITAVAATSGCLFTGRLDGSIACYYLGTLDVKAPGFIKELRDDVGIGRLWSLMSRGKAAGAVQDMVVCEVCQRKLLFVLHLDGRLRVWDVGSHARVLNHHLNSCEITGTTSRLWVGDANYETNLICLAVLHGSVLESDKEMITVCNFGFIAGEKIILSPDPATRAIPLDQGRLIDLKISSTTVWILKEYESTLYDLSEFCGKTEHTCTYVLQEDFVADQLFQSSEHALDELIWTNNSIFSLMKDHAYFISSIFLRRLLQPGVYQSAALRATILDHKKYLSDYEFQSLTASGLKKEIFAIIEGEGAATSASTMVYYWKNFCSRFFRYWCQNNTPYGLLVDSSNEVIGLIRRTSFSVFRSLQGTEHLIYGSSDEFHDLKNSGLIFPDDNLSNELLFEVLRCMSYINNQLGRASAAIFYESLVTPTISSDDVLFHLLKFLETGYRPSLATPLIAQVGVDIAWEKKQAAHKSQRKFSVDMLLSLHALLSRATTWSGVFDVIEKYLQYLNPHQSNQKFYSNQTFSINSFLLVQATSQVARVMFESAFDVLLLLGYLVNSSGQVNLTQDDVARIKLQLNPMVQEILRQWLTIHFLGTTTTTQPTIQDFSSRLSSLHIGNGADKRSLEERLGSSEFTLACLIDFPSSIEGHHFLCSKSFPKSAQFSSPVQKFSSFIVSGRTGEDFPISSSPTIELASLLLGHGQYEPAENLLLIMDVYSSKRKISLRSEDADGDCCACLHLLGFCLLMRAHIEVHGVLKEQKIHDAVCCFFRAASKQGASQSLHNLSFDTGFKFSGECRSALEWRLQYYQWAMQIFEQYGMSEGACQFALAALEQVDEVLGSSDGNIDDGLPEPATTIRGRLWANVFKFTLDLKHYGDAYCAIISNPDEDSKNICLRRFIIVLCEHGATKVLCDGKLPFVGLIEKVEQELVWKAERSEIFARPNIYKLLYAFEAYRSNWRKAASYMYRYSVRLSKEATMDGNRQLSSALQERLHGLSSAISALQLVDHAFAWIDSQHENYTYIDQGSPNKRARNFLQENSANNNSQTVRVQNHVDIEMLEKEYVMTSAQYLLSLATDKFKYSGTPKLTNLVDVLIQENYYDMAFTVILKFWKGSGLERELERAFISISQQCCGNAVGPSLLGSNVKSNKLLLLSSEDETYVDGKIKSSSVTHQFKGNGQWETLELYLEKYKRLHPRLPIVVAETLLHTDPQIELPLWLVHMFTGGRRTMSWGMAGQESDPATLFRLYVDYGRLAEATNLLLEYLESYASLRPTDVIHRKRMSAIWFPYTTIQRLWCQLEELQSSGHMVEQCDELKRLLHGALLNHLKQVKVDSDDAVAMAHTQEN